MMCSVMQPTYLPWAGYFNLISQADVFVIYDTAEYSKGSWHNRNRVLNNHEATWITIPVTGKSEDSLKNKGINWQSKWTKKHINTLRSIYGKAPYFSELNGLLERIELMSDCSLSECNISIINWIADQLSIETKIILTSDLKLFGDRSEKLRDIIVSTGSNEYLSPVGAKDYIEEDGILEKSKISVIYQEFDPAPYRQFNSLHEFIPRLSIVDVIANIGLKNTKDYIKGRYNE